MSPETGLGGPESADTGVRAPMLPTLINGRWELLLPEHRAERPEWPWWEATRIAAMWHHLEARDLIFDVGAEEGDLPALWASWGCEVALAEPNPRVWPNIKAIFEANGLEPWICWPGFLGPEPRGYSGVDLKPWPPCADGPLIGDHGFLNLCERPDVPVTTIDALAGFKAPQAITIDVEGAELQVLRGAERTLREARPKVFVSIHPDFMRQMYGDEPADLHVLMGDAGYDETYLCTDHEEHWMFLPR